MPSAALLARAAAGDTAPTIADAQPTAFEEPAAEETSRIVHRVRSGESLYSIARKYQTTVGRLRDLNNLRGSTLRIGTRLIIQSGHSSSAQQQ
jgi:membrane-bound lytic murein transglycosylase D